MRRKIGWVVLVALGLVMLGASEQGPRHGAGIGLLFPVGPGAEASGPRQRLVLDASSTRWETLEATRVVQRRLARTVRMDTHRKELAQDVRRLFGDAFYLQRIEIDLEHGGPKKKTLRLKEEVGDEDGMGLEEFWSSPAFARIYTSACKDSLATRLSITLTGLHRTVMSRSQAKGGCQARFLPLTLDPGLNDILLRAKDSQGRILDEEALSLLCTAGLPGDSASSSSSVGFHGHEWPSCAGCHQLQATPEELAAPDGAIRSCSPCHDRLTKGGIVHRPVAALRCLICHQSDERGRMQSDPACVGCHESFRQQLATRPVVHEPVAKGQCTACHDPHASDHAGRLRLAPGAVCVRCHPDKNGPGHPVLNHPVEGAEDPRNPGGKLNCLSCHDPHGGADASLPRLLDGRSRTCAECHAK